MDVRQKAMRENATAYMISTGLTISIDAMKLLAEMIRAAGTVTDTMTTIIETEVGIMAGYARLAGMDPHIGRLVADVVLDADAPSSRIDELTAALAAWAAQDMGTRH